MVAVPSVLPLETGMQIGSKRLRQFLRRPAGVHLRVGPPKAAGPKELRRHGEGLSNAARAAHASDETVPQSVPVDVGISAKCWSE